ncbi:hypothetical protein KUTeg_012972 [Tegillarca granosa]|uniref:Ras-related protein Rab-15 n=1 Tax=Tegillarca granosa TaxID=220873 RepID=A0ABQ9EXU6_TEGGR|nr:hypothetical protein KUTeg_012972 [Tegillarca granosa]
MSKRYDLLLRLLLVGETGVGKTCLLCRYANDEFIDSHISTIGIDFKMKTLDINHKKVKIQIWDTAGQERFESITKQFYRRAQGIMLVYDISSRRSYDAIPKWLSYIQQFASDNVVIMLLGNKKDRTGRREISFEEASKAFYELSQSVLESQNNNREPGEATNTSIQLDNSDVIEHDTTQLIGDNQNKSWSSCCNIL